MPLYEYGCASCGHQFEELVRMSTQDGDVSCPSCGANESSKQLSVPSAPVMGGGGGGAVEACGAPQGACGGCPGAMSH